jgi:hypothetical protein
VREGGFGAETFDVLAGRDDEGAGVPGRDAEQRDGARRDPGDKICEVLVESVDVAVELDRALSHGAERELGCL